MTPFGVSSIVLRWQGPEGLGALAKDSAPAVGRGVGMPVRGEKRSSLTALTLTVPSEDAGPPSAGTHCTGCGRAAGIDTGTGVAGVCVRALMRVRGTEGKYVGVMVWGIEGKYVGVRVPLSDTWYTASKPEPCTDPSDLNSTRIVPEVAVTLAGMVGPLSDAFWTDPSNTVR